MRLSSLFSPRLEFCFRKKGLVPPTFQKALSMSEILETERSLRLHARGDNLPPHSGLKKAQASGRASAHRAVRRRGLGGLTPCRSPKRNHQASATFVFGAILFVETLCSVTHVGTRTAVR